MRCRSVSNILALAALASHALLACTQRTVVRGYRDNIPQSPSRIPRRSGGHVAQGTSLKNLLASKASRTGSDPHWKVFYDIESGHPYYFNTKTDTTQWENPFGEGEALDPYNIDYESWRIYDTLEFVGLFDDLEAVTHRRRLPSTGTNSEAVHQISEIAGMDFDVAQAKLEVSIFKTELEVYEGSDLPARDSWLRTDGRDEEQMVVAQPPEFVSEQNRIRLAGAWNDLANMWFARGEWEAMFDCWRKSLFWNPEQTSTLLNMASVLTRLGFERDAHVVMEFYEDVAGGTQGGWTPENEADVKSAIDSGLRLAKRNNGQTVGQRMLAADSMMDEEYVRMLERKATGVPMHQHNELVNHVATSRNKQFSWNILYTEGLPAFLALAWEHVSQTTQAEDAFAIAFITALACFMLTLSQQRKG